MMLQWIGAVLVVAGCGGFGLSLVSAKKREEHMLRQVLHAVSEMEWELQYRLTPLPLLCRHAGQACRGQVRKVFLRLSKHLEEFSDAEVSGCMNAVLQENDDLPRPVRRILRILGNSLGNYDLSGQLQSLSAVQAACRKELNALETNRDERLRSYQTLALCAGAAVAILFA